MSNVRYDRLNPIQQARVKTLVMAASQAPIFVATSQGWINLCAVERIAPRLVDTGADIEATLIIHLFSGVHIHLDPEESDRLLELVPVWCNLQTSATDPNKLF